MFKKFVLIISLVTIIAATALITHLNVTTENSWNTYYQAYVQDKQLIIDNYFHELINHNLQVIESHGYWTDAQEQVATQNSEWIKENMTAYLFETTNNDLSHIFVTNEDLSYIQENGDNIYFSNLENDVVIQDALNNDSINSYVKLINHDYYLITASPLKDNDYENPWGLYVCLVNLNDSLADLKTVLGSTLINIHFDQLPHENSDEIKETLQYSSPLLDSNFYITFTTNNQNLYRILFTDKNTLIYVTLILAFIVSSSLIILIRYITYKIRLLNNDIKIIAEGNYDYPINQTVVKFISELKDLSASIKNFTSNILNYRDNLEKANLEIVEVVLNAVKINDRYTAYHNVNVKEYAEIIAKKINYQDLANLALSAKLHDIGKISIPTIILNKPGPLNKEEYEIIKTHPQEGYNFVKNISYFENTIDGILYHHEKWDGTGYPKGLKGQEIPLMAQIIAIADNYDALTTNRAYRKALSHQEAYNIIVSGSNTFFNPKLVDVFKNSEQEFKATLAKLQAAYQEINEDD